MEVEAASEGCSGRAASWVVGAAASVAGSVEPRGARLVEDSWVGTGSSAAGEASEDSEGLTAAESAAEARAREGRGVEERGREAGGAGLAAERWVGTRERACRAAKQAACSGWVPREGWDLETRVAALPAASAERVAAASGADAATAAGAGRVRVVVEAASSAAAD